MLFTTTASQAADEELRWYEVELIIFDHHSQESLDSEKWPLDNTLPQFDSAVSLVTDHEGQTPVAFEVLGPNELHLAPEAKRLAAKSGYRVLLHTGWRQPVLERTQAQPVIIYSGANPLQAGPSGDDAGTGKFEADEQSLATEQVFGTITVAINRYLHISADLIFNLPQQTPVEMPPAQEGPDGKASDTPPDVAASPTQAATITTPRYYALRETRRMRSKELHYFDHPAFGMLAVIRPYGQAAAPEKQPPAVDAPEEAPAEDSVTSPAD
ncbi:MAG: hypothetical protein A2V90_08430 [Gammaproteobacteria bacterium RBG_16_57_12]|nr:MAG: hypothetical protein A2V90_08430 [Gammaproteobacteria bacterium RBG_16_57_12]